MLPVLALRRDLPDVSVLHSLGNRYSGFVYNSKKVVEDLAKLEVL